MPNAKRPKIGESRVIDGQKITATKRAGSPRAKRVAIRMQAKLRRHTALKMYAEGFSQKDIGRALGGITQSAVSQLLEKAWERDMPPELVQTFADAQRLAIAQCDAQIANYAERARTNIRASELVLAWRQRQDRVQGLYTDHHTLSVNGNGQPDPATPKFDYSKLTEEQLHQLETLTAIGYGDEPPAPYVPLGGVREIEHTKPPAKVLLEPARITQDDPTVVAVVEREPLAERIARLQDAGIRDGKELARQAGCSIDTLHAALNGTGSANTFSIHK